MTLALFLTHWFQYFYIPTRGPWYAGNVWGNAMVILVLAPLGWLWSRTKWWPLRPISHAIHGLHLKFDGHAASLESLHEKLDMHGDRLAALHVKHDALAAQLTDPKGDH